MHSTTKKRIVTVVIAGLVAFVCAATAVVFQDHLRRAARSAYLYFSTPDYQKDNELLRFAFTDDLADDVELIHPPCKSIDELSRQINALFVDAALFDDAYKNIECRTGKYPQKHVFSLDYKLKNDYLAYAYFNRSDCGAVGKYVAVIIPPTGRNLSSRIYRGREETGCGDIVDLLFCDTYVLVKPNEDFLAIHNGDKKLNYDFVINHLLNSGGSYSARYIIDAMAIVKYLKKHYENVFVLGYSQGGAATLLVALQSQPAAAVVASGYSVLDDKIEYSGFEQIVIPSLRVRYSAENIRKAMGTSPTRFLFTYGRGETSVYKIEAEEGYTSKFFAGLKNVRFLTHDGGHKLPNKQVIEFIMDEVSSSWMK